MLPTPLTALEVLVCLVLRLFTEVLVILPNTDNKFYLLLSSVPLFGSLQSIFLWGTTCPLVPERCIVTSLAALLGFHYGLVSGGTKAILNLLVEGQHI